MTTSRKRIGAPIQLVPGRDDDLIRWLNALPSGTHNQVLKDTLRAGLGLQNHQPHRDQEATHDEVLVRKLVQLEEEYRQKMQWIDQWIAYIDGQVKALNSSPAALRQPQAQEQDPERISQREKSVRKDRLRKAQW